MTASKRKTTIGCVLGIVVLVLLLCLSAIGLAFSQTTQGKHYIAEWQATRAAVYATTEAGYYGPMPTALVQNERTVKNTGGADYIKDLTVYEEGDGVVVYFVVCTAEGKMTKAKGRAVLSIVARGETTHTAYEVVKEVDYEDFYKTKIGQGSFERDGLIYSFGRIPYGRWFIPPDGQQVFEATLSFLRDDFVSMSAKDVFVSE